ncbi:MAG: hypothetical protein Q4G44_10745 [Alcaligenaceae bacterium]|jgi:hypothetical protein|nr:hypothetical protein [Alcaligenaceae bacterium]
MANSFFSIGERAPWGSFPSIICNDTAGSLSAYPEYASAKAGDTKAAFELISKTLKKSTMMHCATLIKIPCLIKSIKKTLSTLPLEFQGAFFMVRI